MSSWQHVVLLVVLGGWAHLVCRREEYYVHAKVVAAAVLPHGDFAYDPTLLGPRCLPFEDNPVSSNKTTSASAEGRDECPPGTKVNLARTAADRVSSAANSVGQWLENVIQPDLIILSTPHGLALSNDFGVFLNPTLTGYATFPNDPLPPPVQNDTSYTIVLPPISINTDLAQRIVDWHRPENGRLNVSGILIPTAENRDIPSILRWGEVIPLSFLHDRGSTTNNCHGPASQLKPCRRHNRHPPLHIILSHPTRRFTEAGTLEMVNELVGLGRKLRLLLDGGVTKESPYHFLKRQGIPSPSHRTAVVVSGDLSHTHRPDGPYGYNKTSAVFDKVVSDWAKNPCLCSSKLLTDAREMQSSAKGCGFTGLVMLHGLLCGGAGVNEDSDFASTTTEEAPPRTEDGWNATVWANDNATYYGMMVASYALIPSDFGAEHTMSNPQQAAEG
jgi:aromatic ring-opening dioxygenase LigB subunit